MKIKNLLIKINFSLENNENKVIYLNYQYFLKCPVFFQMILF